VIATEAAAFRAAASKPFSIGMSPINVDDWIEVDDLHAEHVALKAGILAREGREAFDALPGSEAAQAEAAERLGAHMRRRFPEISLAALERRTPPLEAISRCVQEDLLLMGRQDEGWTLIAGSLCFPTTWRLGEKIGRPMAAIHESVPGFAGPMGERIHRIFDRLRAETPVERHNLSLYADAELRHETPKTGEERFPANLAVLSRAHLRVERQTLSRLPTSGALLFTVRIHLLPVSQLSAGSRGAELARLVGAHVAAMTEAQLAYKGLRGARERLLGALEALAREARASAPAPSEAAGEGLP
jgi:hypothetical protein